jgi:Delta3-Delta2-enoyl-CoA isomerase
VTVTLTYRDAVAVLDVGDDENRFSPDWLDAVDASLDQVVAGGPTALVTIGTGKFFSNGLDLDWLTANPDQWLPYAHRVQLLLARILTLPVPTMAAVNGHAFGAGAMLAMAHDFRVMRGDRGFLCFPEVDIRIPFTPGMSALILAKTTPQTAVAAMTTGRRYGGADAHAAGLVDATADETTLGTIKTTMYAGAAAALRDAGA